MYFTDILFSKIKRLINPIDYWKQKGVNLKGGCEISNSASFGSEPYLVSLGSYVRVNSGVQFVTHDGGVWVLRHYLNIEEASNIDLFGPIKVGNNVHIGTNAIIMPGVTIGDNCIIGCGAIVTKDVPDKSIAVGIPARVIETIDEYYIKNKNDFEFTKKYSVEKKKSYLIKKYKC